MLEQTDASGLLQGKLPMYSYLKSESGACLIGQRDRASSSLTRRPTLQLQQVCESSMLHRTASVLLPMLENNNIDVL